MSKEGAPLRFVPNVIAILKGLPSSPLIIATMIVIMPYKASLIYERVPNGPSTTTNNIQYWLQSAIKLDMKPTVMDIFEKNQRRGDNLG